MNNLVCISGPLNAFKALQCPTPCSLHNSDVDKNKKSGKEDISIHHLKNVISQEPPWKEREIKDLLIYKPPGPSWATLSLISST